MIPLRHYLSHMTPFKLFSVFMILTLWIGGTKKIYAQCDTHEFLMPEYSIIQKHTKEYLRTAKIINPGDRFQIPHDKLYVEAIIDPAQRDYDFIIDTLQGFSNSDEEEPYTICMLKEFTSILYPIWRDVYAPMTVFIHAPKGFEWDHMSQHDHGDYWLWTNTWHKNESPPKLFTRKMRSKSL